MISKLPWPTSDFGTRAYLNSFQRTLASIFRAPGSEYLDFGLYTFQWVPYHFTLMSSGLRATQGFLLVHLLIFSELISSELYASELLLPKYIVSIHSVFLCPSISFLRILPLLLQHSSLQFSFAPTVN